MLRIVQYEVYFLDDARWYFHARYPGAEREEALSDAYRTENRTGYPTKVIKDTYHRDLNYSEETTAYISPNAKRITAKSTRKKGQSSQTSNKRGQSNTNSSGVHLADSGKGPPPLPINGAAFFVRLALALGGSMVLAAALTALLGTALNAFGKLGYRLSSDTGSQITIYWYIAMFLLSAVALNKAYVPWRRLFAGKPATKSVEPKTNRLTAETDMTLKPKRPDAKRKAEEAIATLDMKTKRGDLDTTEDLEPDLEGDWTVDTQREGPSTIAPSTSSKEVNEANPPIDKTHESESETGTDDANESPKTDSSTSSDILDQVNSDTPVPLTDMNIERLIMIRFLGELVMTLRANSDQMDARTRFGVSLYLAGASSALADQRGLTPDSERDVLSNALKLIGHSSAMNESFFATYDENISAAKNTEIIQAGFQGMLQHLQTSSQPTKELGGLLKKWHMPSAAPLPELGEIFILTYANIQNLNSHESADILMDSHNRSVRKAISDHNGKEVRHTGKGIFARFEYPDDAVCAAIAIQQDREFQRKTATPPPPVRIAVTASLPNQSDPDFSGDLFSHTDSVCRRLTDDRIACDAVLRDACTINNVVFGQAVAKAHSGIAEKSDTFEILWSPLPA